MHFLNLQKKILGNFYFCKSRNFDKKRKSLFFKKKLHFLAPKSHKRDDMYGREIVIQIEIIYVCLSFENITKFIFFSILFFLGIIILIPWNQKVNGKRLQPK